MTKVKEVLRYINKHGEVTAEEVLGGNVYAHIVLGKLAKAGKIVRTARGRYASLASGLPCMETKYHRQQILALISYARCFSTAEIRTDAQIPSKVYAQKLLTDLTKEGVLVRVKRGWYARKGSSFDRSTPKRGPAAAVGPRGSVNQQNTPS